MPFSAWPYFRYLNPKLNYLTNLTLLTINYFKMARWKQSWFWQGKEGVFSHDHREILTKVCCRLFIKTLKNNFNLWLAMSDDPFNKHKIRSLLRQKSVNSIVPKLKCDWLFITKEKKLQWLCQNHKSNCIIVKFHWKKHPDKKYLPIRTESNFNNILFLSSRKMENCQEWENYVAACKFFIEFLWCGVDMEGVCYASSLDTVRPVFPCPVFPLLSCPYLVSFLFSCSSHH